MNIIELAGRAVGGSVGSALRGLRSGLRGGDDFESGIMAYRGGRVERLDADFVPQLIGPNARADQRLDLLRRRVRELVVDNPVIAGASRLIENNAVGAHGIQPVPMTRWRDLNKRLDEFWEAMAEAVDEDRSMNIAESQRLFSREVFGAGESAVHFAFVPAHNGFMPGPCIELIDAERLELGYSDHSVANGVRQGNTIRQSVELNRYYQRVAYHVLEEHPNDGGYRTFGNVTANRRRIPSSRLKLAFFRHRSRQLRGIPWPVSVVNQTMTEDQFVEAFVQLARVAAAFGLIVKLGGSPTLTTGKAKTKLYDSDNKIVRRLSPGQVVYLPPGADVINAASNAHSPEIDRTVAMITRKIAAGTGLSYSALSRDFTRSTFSSNRAEQLDDRKTYRPWQYFIWTNHTRPFYREVVAWGIGLGLIKLTAEQARIYQTNPSEIYAAGMAAPGWDWVNPAQEAAAAEIGLRSGTTSLYHEAAQRGLRRGQTTREYYEAIDEENEYRKARGLPEITDIPPITLVKSNGPSTLVLGSEDDAATEADSTGNEEDPARNERDRERGEVAHAA